VAEAAFLASVCQAVQDLQHQVRVFDAEACSRFSEFARCHQALLDKGVTSIMASPGELWDASSEGVPVDHMQKVLTMALEHNMLEKLAPELSRSDCARMLSAAGRNAGLWLTTVPSSREFELTDIQFSLAMRHLLGLPPAEQLPPQCACLQDLLPDHFHSCIKLRKTAVNTRHNFVLSCLQRLAREAGTGMEMEPKIGERSQRTDGYYIGFTKLVHVDVGITHPGAPTHLAAAARRPLKAAAAYEQLKIREYEQTALLEGATFTPFIMESHGAFGALCRPFLATVAEDASTHASEGFSGEDRFLARAYRLLSFALQRGNAIVGGHGVRLVNRHALAGHFAAGGEPADDIDNDDNGEADEE
jgi:hypothetical protein